MENQEIDASLVETWSAQYGLPAVSVSDYRRCDPEKLIEMCRDVGAVRKVDGEEFFCDLRPEIGPELWTESALRRGCGR